MKKTGWGCLVFFGLFWSAITGAFDVIILRDLICQVRAKSFASTEGTILRSQVTRGSGSKGGSVYGVEIAYTYEVAGKEFQSSRYRYDTAKSSDSAWAHRAVAENPAGSRAKVYFNPRNPSDAVLSPGVAGSELFMLLFMTPFNLVMFAIWGSGLMLLKDALSPSETGGALVIHENFRTRVRLPDYSAVMAGAAVLGALTFGSIFIIGFCTGFHPSLKTMQSVWTVIIVLTVGAYLWRRRVIHSGVEDLVIDEGTQTLSLPRTCGRKATVTAPLSSVRSVFVKETITRGNKGSTSVRSKRRIGRGSSAAREVDGCKARHKVRSLAEQKTWR